MTTRIKLNIDRTPYKEKPTSADVQNHIRNRLADGYTEIDASEIIEVIESGATFTPALMTGTSGSTWQSQQVIVADIDNDKDLTDENGRKVKDETGHVKKVPVIPQLPSKRAAALCEAAGITPYLFYHSFSNGKELDGVKLEKYRIVIILDQPITDAKEAVELTKRFANLFNTIAPGAADTSIKDNARLIFGSTKGSIFNNSGSITPLEVMRALPKIQPENDALAWDDPIEEPTPKGQIKNNGGWYDKYTTRSGLYDDIKEQRRYDIENFDLYGYIMRTEAPRPHERRSGNTTYLNPCPICGHNDDFTVNGYIWRCFGAGGDVGGTIIDYIMHRENKTLQEALQKFDSIMGYDQPKVLPKVELTDAEILGPKKTETDPANQEPAEEHHFSKNQQLTILGNWLNNNHREDIPLFGKGLFDFKNLYKEIVAGDKTFLQIKAENKNDGVTITAITAAVESAGAALAEATYQEAKAEALLAQRAKLIEIMARPGVDIPFATEHLLRVQAAIDQREVKPAAVNLSETLLNAIDKDAQALKLRYGRGFEELDKRTGSMKAGQLIVLAARPATGKSAAALQIAYNIASKGAKTLFFPLEMTTRETLERLVLQQEVIDGPEALAAPTADEKEALKSFLDDVEASGKLLFYEGVNNLEAITQTIKEQRPAFVVIDQLTQVRTARRAKDIRERYVEITADLKHIAIEYQTTILLLTQLNRESTKQGRPTLENLHESDATGQNADVVLLMQKRDPDETRPEFARSDVIDIHVVKNRGGQSEFKVTVKFNGRRTKFYRN